MRAQVEIVEEIGAVRIELLENARTDDVRALAHAVAECAGFRAGMHALIDLRALTEYPTDEEISNLARDCRLLWLTGVIRCTALVVQRDGFRAARTFQIHSGDGDPRLAVFRSPDDAMRWLSMDRVRSNVPPMASAVA